jgi:ABC-type polysaccharide/polyol phosphate transport system ATPase subunit
MVRLVFAVAAFLEPEILIIDGFLAVEMPSSRKAIGKMQDISTTGRKDGVVCESIWRLSKSYVLNVFY